MKVRCTSAIVIWVGLLGTTVLRGQEEPETIPNWPAPLSWQLTASEGTEASGHRFGLTAQSAIASPLPFIAATPCRIADTRGNGFTGAYGPPSLAGGSPRNFTLTGQCGIASTAQAVSLNVTVTNTQGPGFILIYPQGGTQPTVSTLNYVAGQTIANAAVVPLGGGGGITVIAGVSGTDLILDTNGYYAGAGAGAANTFLGLNSGNYTMTGAGNTAVGSNTLSSNTTGGDNTAIGYYALFTNSTGVGNVAIGYEALRNQTGGTGNVAIGQYAGLNLTSGSSNILIGNNGFSSESNRMRIGDDSNQFQTYIAGIYGGTISGDPVVVSSIGQLGRSASSRRFKEDIRDIAEESDALMKLRPVAFRYKRDLDPAGLPQYGLIAEEVAEIYPDLVSYDRDGRPETVRYQLVNALLLNEVQKQHRTIDLLLRRVEDLESRLVKTSP